MDFIIPEREAKGLASSWRMGQKTRFLLTLLFLWPSKVRRDQHAQKKPPPSLLFLL